MEKKALITAMKNSISDVLEKMFFLPLDFFEAVGQEELWNRDERDLVTSTLNFHGPFSGHFTFFIPKKLAFFLAANFLGSDEESVSQDQATETMKEIVNMIAGNTFSNYDDKAIFNLEIPKLVDFSQIGNKDLNSEEVFIAVKTLESNLAMKMVVAG
ncbi:MAG: chemotaxis protein CheX [Thermodesulfobacteriota bacterium]|nr:chemotaxis protein CheX [Thermodesulfobacteriota bacterium]